MSIMQTEALLSARELELLRFQAQRLPQYRAHGTSQLSGAQRSLQRGAGMELEDLRPYQIGDDVRHIAWRATARSGRPISKVFRAERRQRILLLIEQQPGMAFATRGELKAAVACRATALISFAALRQGAEVGAMLVGKENQFFQASTQLDQTLAMIGQVNHHPGHDYTPAEPVNTIKQLQQLAQRHDTIYLLSDFHNWTDELTTPLAQLAEWHNLQALQIIDRGEQTLTAVGKLRIRSPFDGSECVIDTDNAQLRQEYAASMAARQQQLEQLLRRSGVQHHPLYTDADIMAPLAQAL